jgi:hypothetical protein
MPKGLTIGSKTCYGSSTRLYGARSHQRVHNNTHKISFSQIFIFKKFFAPFFRAPEAVAHTFRNHLLWLRILIFFPTFRTFSHFLLHGIEPPDDYWTSEVSTCACVIATLLSKTNSFLGNSHVYQISQVLYLMGRFTTYITSLLW